VLYNVNKGGETVVEEQLKAEIVRLTEELTNSTKVVDNLKKTEEAHKTRINELLAENNKLFNKVLNKEVAEPGAGETKVTDLKEFAKTLKL
jgi:hypothetical protein